MLEKMRIKICLAVCLIVTAVGLIKNISFMDLGLLLIFAIAVFYPLGAIMENEFKKSWPGRSKNIDETSMEPHNDSEA
ncbi:MAG: hypothetical protein LBT44_06090 [Clostridiales bacterium]|jgi:hypothetical protein|nr:hypothetical protein [Clostridiales bacterium]